MKPKLNEAKFPRLRENLLVQATTRTTEDGIPELTRIPEKIATTEHFILLAR